MNNYNNIDEIKKDFGFTSNDLSEIKTELKVLLKEIHPDKNKGAFKNKLEEINYHKIISALDYLNQDFTLIPNSKLTQLSKIENNSLNIEIEDKKLEKLDVMINQTIKDYKTSKLTPLLSSTAIASIISFFWLFPSAVKEHPILHILVEPNSLTYNYFTLFWLFMVGITGIYWLSTKRKELNLKKAIKGLSLESTQNILFKNFINSKKYYSEKKNLNQVIFSTDELIKYLLDIDIFTLEYNPVIRYRRKKFIATIRFFKKKPRNFDLELSQPLSNIIIDRACKKEILIKEETGDLSDTYSLNIKTNDN